MRWAAVAAVVVVALMILAGWLYFRSTDTTGEVILDKQEMREDTQEAIDKSKELVEEAAEGAKGLSEKAQRAVSDDAEPDQNDSPKEPAATP